MRKVIDGRVYDTDTAVFLDGLDMISCGAINCFSECLYMNENKEFFLYGEGAPGTRYGNRDDFTNWKCGADIIPLTDEEAQIWLKNVSLIKEAKDKG